MRRPPLLTLFALVLLAAGCREAPTRAIPPPEEKMPDLEPETADVRGVARAIARIEPTRAGSARGTVTFERVAGGVRVQADLTGLSNSDFHGFQVLRGRDCSADPAVHLGVDAGTPHGAPYEPAGLRHAGDLGSVRGDGGRGRCDRVDPVLSLDGRASVVGRAVVIRQRRDDAVNPDGNAGAVIGCGLAESR